MIAAPIEGGQAQEWGSTRLDATQSSCLVAVKTALLRTAGSVASTMVLWVAMGLRWMPAQRSSEDHSGGPHGEGFPT